MRIAQVAPLYESVPPRKYGGTERVVSFLTEQLVSMGHDVTLFASGDSLTAADLVPCCEQSLRLDPTCTLPVIKHTVLLEKVLRRASTFDVVHFHTDFLHFPIARRLGVPNLTTLHGRLDYPELDPLFDACDDVPLVSISEAQRAPLRRANWLGTVHHGLPLELMAFRPGPGEYFAFLGRVSPEKRLDRAIGISKRLGVPLRVAAKVDPADVEYFTREIQPLLDDPLIEFIGEIGEYDKRDFLGNARALLFPIDWPEPFGLVMIESLACGTPVLAYRRGSVPEILEDGVTGFIVDDLEQAIEAGRQIGRIDRWHCREVFETRFSAERMMWDYLELYRGLIRECDKRLQIVS
jgi:glycosyltransferase involved in cell wall biosynthesis